MGCFLACFGYSKKRKGRKPANKIIPGDQRHGSYQPLDSFVSTREKPKEPSSLKNRKKVSFNLNVKTYEPIQKEEKNEEETVNAYPPNHRYRNCQDSYEEEDEIVLDDFDLDDDYDDDGYGDETSGQEEFSEEFHVKEAPLMTLPLVEDKTNNLTQLQLSENARIRSQYVHSVLNPVQNVIQWRAVKSKKPPLENRRKENIALEQEKQITNSNNSKLLLQQVAIDASLSNWMGSSVSHTRDKKIN